VRILVVGAGTMGRGIAQLVALHGHDALLSDADDARTAQAIEAAGASLGRAAASGRISSELATEAHARMAPDDGGDVELAVEAVPEVLGLKQSIIARLDERLPATAIVATNTSSLSIGTIAGELPGRARIIGMHFFNPPVAMPLIEIVRGKATDESVVERTRELAVSLGKEPIIVRDMPGFATSRLGIVLGLEAARMLEQGVASAADIDRAMELGYGHPMGPLRLGDLVGLDVRLAIAEHLEQELGSAFTPPQILRDLVAAGHLGRKTGRGFHEYPDAATRAPSTAP
jgi:3-hydroxybutyryl-CoA dehydrogenase